MLLRFYCNKDKEIMQEEREKLIDKKNGKKIDWRKYKLRSLELAHVYYRLGFESKYLRVHQCSSCLSFKKYDDGSLKLFRAYFCKVRLCPMCSWRRSLKVFGQVSRVMDYLDEHYTYRYIFCTFTVRNVSGEMLKDSMDLLFKSFNLLTKRKEFKNMSKGWFRCLEVTHNWARDDYHPHFHVIIAVNKSYFTESSIYLNQKKWTALWRSCLGVDYDPIVDVRTVKANKEGKYSRAVAEASKYSVKHNDYFLSDDDAKKIFASEIDEDIISLIDAKTNDAVLYVDSCLRHRRLVAFGGIFKTVHKLLNLDDVVEGNMVNVDGTEENIRDDLDYVIQSYEWNVGCKDYFKS